MIWWSALVEADLPGVLIRGIEQEDIGLGLADVLDECGHLGNATNHFLILKPERRDRVVGTFDVVGEVGVTARRRLVI